EQQAARYNDQVQRIAHIAWEKNDDGTFNITAPLRDSSGPPVYKEDLSVDQVRALVGKDVAEKIANGEGRPDEDAPYRDWRILEGDDLTIGGAGMMAFYDRMLPNMVNKYIKKWGAQVGNAKIPTSNLGDQNRAQAEAGVFTNISPEDAMGGLETAHAFDITNPMREAAQAGQPLFSRRPLSRRGEMHLVSTDEAGNTRAAARVHDGKWEIIVPSADTFMGYTVLRAPNRKRAEEIMAQYGNVELHMPETTSAQKRLGFNTIDQTEGSYVSDVAAWVQFNLQDRFNALKKVEKEGERADEAILPENERTYDRESVWSGRAAARMGEFEETQVDPLIQALIRSGIGFKSLSEYASNLSREILDRFGDMSAIDAYLYARHAPEANKVLEEINPGETMKSGMSDEHAAQIFEALNNESFESLAARVDAIVEQTRDLLVSSGLHKKKDVMSWRSRYQHYVPLKGVPAHLRRTHGIGLPRSLNPFNRDKPEQGDGIEGRARGFSGRGSLVKQRLGRNSPAEHILVNVIGAHQTTIARAEKNRVAQTFLRFARRHPSDRWEVNAPNTTRRLDPVTDTVELYYAPNNNLDPNIFVVRVDGVEHHIEFNPQSVDAMRMADALNNLSIQQMNWAVRTGLAINRYLSATSTSLNPEFMITNMARDLQTAFINLNDTDAHNLKLKIIGDTVSGKAYRAIRKYQHGKRGSEYAKYYHDFLMDGAQTGWMEGYDTVDDMAKDLGKKLKRESPGTWAFSKRQTRNLFQYIGNVNSAVENGIRLSAYIHARKAGVSREKAAVLAKNLTVNFNRKGNIGQGLNASYLFYNAATQGTARLFQAAVRSPKARRFMMAAVALGFAQDMANSWLAGEDDDGRNRYDKIPDYIKRMNWIIMLPQNEVTPDWVPDWALGPNGDYIKIPMPYGYNMFAYTGQIISRATRAASGNLPEYDPAADAMSYAIGMVTSFNPVGYSASLLQIAMPTAADPFIQWAQNKTWFGIPIRPEPDPYGPPPPNYPPPVAYPPPALRPRRDSRGRP
ncbi:MAG: hypothetical protein L0H75_07720, partial [Nitrosospira sp.]|nr:hypothetical protein [Nitrosospira sp.]